jgi:hypothetical protein
MCDLADDLGIVDPGEKFADRLRSRQRLNGQARTVALRQLRCCASTSIHLAPHLKTSGCQHPSWKRQHGFTKLHV